MCYLSGFGDLLTGLGTFMVGIAALVLLPKQLGYKRKAERLEVEMKEQRASLKLMLNAYRAFMASGDGIVWSHYPDNAEQILGALSKQTGLAPATVKELLDELRQEGKLK